MISPVGEDWLERLAIGEFAKLGWETVNAYHETYGPDGTLGRDNRSEVVLYRHLRPALQRLNPDAPREAIQAAIQDLSTERPGVGITRANQEVWKLLRGGVKVPVRDEEGGETVETVRVIDWDEPANNHFLLVSQFWVTGEMHTRRADLVGFVNGIPLAFVELKASHTKLENAYRNNLRDYKDTIPNLFWYNALILLSNGSESRVGSVSAEWGHFSEWKRINSEGEEGVVSLDTTVRATCEPARLLDLTENYAVFLELGGGLVKILAKNHQYLGVENAIEAVRDIQGRQGRLGVFWHTQGSGKTVSMIFFSQKILRKYEGNWTFVVVTDRIDLDDQAYGTFQDAGVVTKKNVQATSGADLKKLLTEDHRYVFTIIHKFRTERGETYPALSDRSDIIVMTDEAHRSQYDVLALNMRNALPNASFIGFTGTPLIAGEELTRQVFGDYVSTYDFKQSIDDGATVPLYYENRVPELQIIDKDFNEKMETVIEEAELDVAQELRLAKEFGREYHLITREDRLERTAEDIVEHFVGRGFRGKGMVVSIDRPTAVRMYDKVQAHWKRRLGELKAKLAAAEESDERDVLRAEIAWMEETDMAVVVSQAQNEIADMAELGLDIRPHRERMIKEDLEKKFKDPDDPFRLVFVCAMWMTGFDVPSCSTIYLDKPMRNHTLMQAIARANRVFRDKNNGLIVDYIGIFRDLEKALAIYGSGPSGEPGAGEKPVLPKEELVAELKRAIEEVTEFCAERGILLDALLEAEGFEYIRQRDDAVDLLLVTDGTRREYLQLADRVNKLFKAILPDPMANEFGPKRAVFVNLADKIRSLTPTADISEVMKEVERLLDESVAPKPYRIRAAEDQEAEDQPIDISKIDFDALAARFARSRKHIEIEKLRAAVSKTLVQMVKRNPTRQEYLEKFQKLIDEYNRGHQSPDEIFQLLMQFTKSLEEEDQRRIAESLEEEELTVFDLLTKPEIELTKDDRKRVKKVARELLDVLKEQKLVLDWRKKQQSRAQVRLAIEKKLDELPRVYTKDVFKTKCDLVYQHIYDSYFGEGQSIYATAA